MKHFPAINCKAPLKLYVTAAIVLNAGYVLKAALGNIMVV